MAIPLISRSWLLALALIASAAGCATYRQNDCECGDECGGCSLTSVVCGIYHGTLADEAVCGCGCLSQSRAAWGVQPVTCGPDCETCQQCSICPFGLERPIFQRPQAGPPPTRYRPETPPKFLPVPTETILSPVRPDAPEHVFGDIETGYRPQLTSPGRD